MVSVTPYTLLCLLFIPCNAFVRAGPFTTRSTTAAVPIPDVRNSMTPTDPSSWSIQIPRGGGGGGPLNAGADYSEAARVLFGNIISPAAMLSGGLVPLGFLAEPLPNDRPWQKKLRCIYAYLSVVSLANELLAITHATVASNKLTEMSVAPAASVFALIKRDFELPWIATNVHFMLGLMGFVGMIMIRAFTIFPAELNKAAAGFGGAALLLMCSVVNTGIQAGDGRGRRLGGNIVSITARYAVLASKQVFNREVGGVLSVAAILLATVSFFVAARNLLAPEPS